MQNMPKHSETGGETNNFYEKRIKIIAEDDEIGFNESGTK